MKFTVLIENSGSEPLYSEHGLSFLIEYKNDKFLLDAGTTDLFFENAKMLNEPVLDIETCFLSHGHYDHSGGFARYLSENENAVLYMMEDATENYYSASGELHPIGIPEDVLKKHSKRFRFINGMTKFQEGIYLIPHSTAGLEEIGERAKLYRKVDGVLIPDNFSHEMSLVFETEKGLVIFNSCSHGGSQNIIHEVMEALPDKKVYAFIGGLHMKGGLFSDEEIHVLCEELKELELKVLYTGHCTGEPALEMLKKYMGEQVKELYTGLTVEL